MVKILLTIGSMTHSFKAQEVLNRSRIRSSVIRLPAGTDVDGCTQGVEVSAKDAQRALEILTQSGIRVTHLRRRER